MRYKIRKILSLLFLIGIPCLVITVGVNSCNVYRDWCIDKGGVKLAGYTEREALEALSWAPPEEREEAKKEIMAVFTKHWTIYADENKAVKELKEVFDSHGMLWESWTPK